MTGGPVALAPLESRSLDAAQLLHDGAPRREGASYGQCREADGLPGDTGHQFGGIWGVIGDRRQKAPTVGMAGAREDVLDPSFFHDLAEVHDDHAIAEVPNDTQIVADEQQSDTELLPEVTEEIQDSAPGPIRPDRKRSRRR